MPYDIHLSVVLPAYNEESRLPGTLSDIAAYLAAQSYTSEVIVVDDGSTDGTARVLRGRGDLQSLRLLQHPDKANHGKGAAVRLGMLSARGAYRIFMDADNSTTLEQIAGFWPWFDRGCQVVIGSRRARGASIQVRQAWYKEFAGRCGNLAIRALAVPGIEDTQAGFKMFTGPAAEAIFSRQTIERWGYDVELLAIARVLGFRIREVPIIWINAPGSKVSAAAYLEVLREVWRIRRNIRSGRYLAVAEAGSQEPEAN